MTKPQWIKAIEHWRSLPQEERRRRHLQAILRHVANSMAMAEDAVDEDWIRGYVEEHERSVRHLQKIVRVPVVIGPVIETPEGIT